MRRLRRLTALVASLLMVRLVGSEAPACPMGDDATVAVQVVQSHDAAHAPTPAHQGSLPVPGHHESMPGSPGHHHTPGGSHCATPCPPAGCAATGQCGSALFRDDEDDRPAPFGAASDIVIARSVALHSVSTAPEPPPPRA